MESYWRSLREAGLDPIDLCEPGASLQGSAGLLLTGGRDIDPARYGETLHSETDEPNAERDELEFRLLVAALTQDMPVLAICRGHQLVNVAMGGSLQQHIEGNGHRALDDAGAGSRWHDVSIEPRSRLHGWLGAGRTRVNSRHHQGVTPERLAPGLRIAALSPDGFVEAVESERHSWIVGVQWHPERLEPDADGFVAASRRLFAAFAAAVHGG
jgi:putative glutamine amidotransferase